TLVVIFIVVQAIRRVGSDYEIDTNMMLVVAVIGLVANAISAWVLSSQQDNSLNVKGAFLHVMADLLGSVAVIIAGLVIRFTGFTFADTIASLLIVAFVLPRALGLLWTTIEMMVAEHDYLIVDQAEEALRELGIEHSTILLDHPDHIHHEDFCD